MRTLSILLAPALLLTLAVHLGKAGMSWSSDFRKSADFQKGAAAYENGDFATALREWTPQALYFLRKINW